MLDEALENYRVNKKMDVQTPSSLTRKTIHKIWSHAMKFWILSLSFHVRDLIL
jgi:hypothetical protein